jgi:hypothetical protein
MSEDELTQLFERRLSDVCCVCGPLTICLIEGPDDLYPEKRSYAFFTVEGSVFAPVKQGTPIIAFSRKFRTATRDRIEAILLHELGHAMDFLADKHPAIPANRRNDISVHRQGTERRADALAEGLWGVNIHYDKDLVQSLCRGVRPRPAFLGL